MKAAMLEGIGKIIVREVNIPLISDDDILLHVDSCGICGSDLRILANGSSRINYPCTIGHEIAGTVTKCGKNQKTKFSLGDRIALSADIPCGKCYWCKVGISNHCNNNIAFGYEYGGGFAEYIKLDKRIIEHGPLVIVKNNSISQDELCQSELLSCCINACELTKMGKEKSVLIYGAGPAGSMLAKCARLMHASPIVVCEKDKARLEKAKQVCSADMVVDFSNEELKNASKKLTGNKGFDIVFTACSALDAQESALQYVKEKGVINLFGGLSDNSIHLKVASNLIHYKEITLLGSHGSTPRHHKMAVEMLLKRKIRVLDIISKTYPLDRINEAFIRANARGHCLKIIIHP